MVCNHILWGMRRKTILVAIISMLLYVGLIAYASVQIKNKDMTHKVAVDQFSNVSGSQKSPNDIHIEAEDSKLLYLFWAWTALTAVITFCIDGAFLLLAGLFRSKFFAHIYLGLMGLLTILNLSPLLYIPDTTGQTEYGIVTALIFVHRLGNCACVWFLLTEIKDFPGGTPPPPIPPRPAPSPSRRTVKPLVTPAPPPPPPAAASPATQSSVIESSVVEQSTVSGPSEPSSPHHHGK